MQGKKEKKNPGYKHHLTKYSLSADQLCLFPLQWRALPPKIGPGLTEGVWQRAVTGLEKRMK